MSIAGVEDTKKWAEEQWGEAQLGDKRRAKRAALLGACIAQQPSESLPQQTGSWSSLKSAYRFLNQADVTHESLIEPHCLNTQAKAAIAAGVVLFIQDTTDANYTHHPNTTGLGLIGDGRSRGFLMHNCLAVVPSAEGARILGLAGQKIWTRHEIKHGTETRTQRSRRWKESQVWAEIVTAIGSAPCRESGTTWVSVGDRASDNFSYWSRGRALGWHVLARVVQQRKIENKAGEEATLLSYAQAMKGRTSKLMVLRGRDGKPRREVKLKIGWSWIKVLPPALCSEKEAEPIEGCVLRCWEESDRAEAIDWVLFTTLAVTKAEEARTVVGWYANRWVIEEYHKCLKTGCKLESRQLERAKGLITFLGFLAIVAVRLLQLRQLSREEPAGLASQSVPPEMVEIVVKKVGLKKAAKRLTIREFWHAVARLGGFIGRKSDGEPGWQTLWGGWQRLQDMCWGVSLNDST